MKSNYQYFLEQAEKHFNQITQMHPNSFKCQKGCHQCCEAGLTILPIEAQNIRNFIQSTPKRKEQIQNNILDNPHQNTRCQMLNSDGECLIYPVRPFICRSHGAPIAIDQEEYFQIDVCPLNFEDNPIEELGPEDFFILDEWNMNLLECNDEDHDSDQRVPLTLKDLMD